MLPRQTLLRFWREVLKGLLGGWRGPTFLRRLPPKLGRLALRWWLVGRCHLVLLRLLPKKPR